MVLNANKIAVIAVASIGLHGGVVCDVPAELSSFVSGDFADFFHVFMFRGRSWCGCLCVGAGFMLNKPWAAIRLIVGASCMIPALRVPRA